MHSETEEQTITVEITQKEYELLQFVREEKKELKTDVGTVLYYSRYYMSSEFYDATLQASSLVLDGLMCKL